LFARYYGGEGLPGDGVFQVILAGADLLCQDGCVCGVEDIKVCTGDWVEVDFASDQIAPAVLFAVVTNHQPNVN
jgi:hypothetical protein